MKGTEAMKYLVALLSVIVAFETVLLIRGLVSEKPKRTVQEMPEPDETLPLEAALVDPDISVRHEAARETFESHRALVRKLVEIVEQGADNPDPYNPALTAVELLGDLRAVGGVHVLIKHIDVYYSPRVAATRPGGSACGVALIQIGKPASITALSLLRNPGSDKRMALFVEVIKGVEGPEVARFLIEDAIKKEKSASGRENLQKALNLL